MSTRSEKRGPGEAGSPQTAGTMQLSSGDLRERTAGTAGPGVGAAGPWFVKGESALAAA